VLETCYPLTWSRAEAENVSTRGQVLCLPLNVAFHKGKGKAIPLEACTDPESSRRLKLPDFKTIGT
jgi:hypothetical protein